MEQTVEQKLKALWLLQAIHTKIDKIRQFVVNYLWRLQILKMRLRV